MSEKKIPILLDKNNIKYLMDVDKTIFEHSDDYAFYLRVYQELLINDSKFVCLYKVYSDDKNRRFKIIYYYDDYEKVLFADNADDVLSILEILFINQSNKRGYKMNKYEFIFEFRNKEITCTIYINPGSERELERNIKNYIIDNYGSDFKLKSIKQIA